MGEIEEWFIEEFSRYGFSVGPTMYDVTSFSPTKPIMLTRNGQMRKTRAHIVPEMVNDITGHFGISPTDEYKSLIREEIYREFGTDLSYLLDFTPKKKITKLRFND